MGGANAGGELGMLLRGHRLTAGLTQEELAERSGLSVRAISNIERGRTAGPYSRSVRMLAEALRLPDQAREQLQQASRVAQSDQPPDSPASTHGDGDQEPQLTVEPHWPGPRQLPSAIRHFVGRADEMVTLGALVGQVGEEPSGAVVAVAIVGTAGVGKTALAVHWAHQVCEHFPDGQLYVNLRGFDPGGVPLTSVQAIRGFLDALVAPERIPPDPDAQASLYRSLLAGKRMLIILDNSCDEQQVRPLLPAGPGHLVVVTSRNQLPGLAAVNGARLLTLDVLTRPEAVRLLTARLGGHQGAVQPDVVDEIAFLCARLPLALAITAARAASRPGFPLSTLLAELRQSAGGLDAFDGRDPLASIRAVFSWSYQQLSAGTARLFRLLGLHPGPDISVPAAASLAGLDRSGTHQMLDELARDCLITEHAPGRYTFHDLLRAYAADQARTFDDKDEREAATGRALDHYLHSGCRAATVLNPGLEPVGIAPQGPGVVPEHLADIQEALAWFDAEHYVLLAAITLAAQSGYDVHAWQIPTTMTAFLAIRGRYLESIATQVTALAAAARLGDSAGQAVSGRLLADAYSALGDYDQVAVHYATSLTLYQQLGNRLGEAKVHRGLSLLGYRQREYADALSHAEQALHLYQAIGHTGGEAETLNDVGFYHGLLGNFQQARTFCQRSLDLAVRSGDRLLEGYVWDSLGYAEHQLGNHAQAAECYQRALSIARELGDRPAEAVTLSHLGDTHQDAGEHRRAQETWKLALAILDEVRHPDAAEIRDKLASSHEQSVGRS
ncbi:MAG TPA: tetratricopeptide repeat protein [Streptosporangiaceae bacterium]|nr:tetratricopeptide repeat protein [Streptosporangiaceae bacterium]